MRHRTPDGYRRMPWANGRGVTLEMLREEDASGLRLRLSMASVVEDGPFSVFPGIERNLTVIAGPGFRLTGPGIDLDCRPLVPVAFAGDAEVRAEGTGGVPSRDLNVMTPRALPRPEVRVMAGGGRVEGRLHLVPLGSVTINGVPAGEHDLVSLAGVAVIAGQAPVVAVRMAG